MPERPALHLVEETGSTQEEIRARLPGAPHGTTVVARRQTAGRGRLGRNWDTADIEALTWSTWLELRLPVEQTPLVSLIAGLVLHEILEEQAAIPAGRLWLKWPNDLIATDGRKLAGILVEGHWHGGRCLGTIVGIGLNLAWRDQPAAMEHPLQDRIVTLSELNGSTPAGLETALDRILEPWCQRMQKELDQLAGSARSAFVRRYNRRLLPAAREVRLEALERPPVLGYIEGIDESGAVLLRRASDDTIVRSGVGELVLADQPMEPGAGTA